MTAFTNTQNSRPLCVGHVALLLSAEWGCAPCFRTATNICPMPITVPDCAASTTGSRPRSSTAVVDQRPGPAVIVKLPPEPGLSRRLSDETRTQTPGPQNEAAAVEVVTCAVRSLLAMTAKETLLQRAPHWSEEQAERALRAAESDDAVDEWGDVSKLHEVSTAETMRRLANEEQAAGHEPW